MNYLIQIFDEGGDELLKFRTTVEADSWSDAEAIAEKYESACYQRDSTVDWYELSHSHW